jgi:signal transduction histidine kinase
MEKGLEFLATVADDLPTAFGDSKRITQCLINLAGNALKFTRHGRVEIRVERQGETLLYRVSDTGIGIPRDQIDHIFSEFRQADPTIAKEFGGTGLGLSITKKFVELHGGRIWVESEPGRGSTFFFTVPLRLATGAAA